MTVCFTTLTPLSFRMKFSAAQRQEEMGRVPIGREEVHVDPSHREGFGTVARPPSTSGHTHTICFKVTGTANLLG